MHAIPHNSFDSIVASRAPSLDHLGDQARAAASVPDDARLTPDMAAEFLSALGVPIRPATLARWRCVRSDGPQFIKVGSRVIYQAGSLRRFAGL